MEEETKFQLFDFPRNQRASRWERRGGSVLPLAH